jgi:hypothetical protein
VVQDFSQQLRVLAIPRRPLRPKTYLLPAVIVVGEIGMRSRSAPDG